MSFLYNLHRTKKRRRRLRNDAPEAERRLWRYLRGKQLGVKFRRQYGIRNFTVDFYCPALHLAIEVDGDSHFLPGASEHDMGRQERLERLGVCVLRFLNTDVNGNIEGVVERIQREIVIFQKKV